MTIGKITLALGPMQGAELDVDRLVVSRMLIQGGSGSGKSTIARRILEQTSGRLQQIIIDPEGEFSTMRQVGDYLLCSADGAGDVLAVPQAANLLARKIRETGVSAVLDVYDLKPDNRKAFVARFLEGLIASPKKYYRDALVFIDEAHMFAPQSQSAESLEAVQDMAARSRKRKLGLICATQRLSKFHKDVVAELQNRIIGQVGLKNDLKSAAEEMGLSFQEAREALLRLKPGQFWTFGPALSPEFTLITAATTKTKAATADTKPAKASGSLEKVIEALGDLPAQAAKEARTLADLQAELAAAKGEIRRLEREGKKPAAAADPEQLAAARAETARIQRHADELTQQLLQTRRSQEIALEHAGKVSRILEEQIAVELPEPGPLPAARLQPPASYSHKKYERPAAPATARPVGTNGRLGKGEAKVLTAIAQHEEGVDREQLSVLTGYKRSSRDTYIQRLVSAGLVNVGPPIAATPEGIAALGPDFEPLPTGAELRRYWLERLPPGEKAVLEAVIGTYSAPLDRDTISEMTGYKRSSRDTYIQRLRSRQLVTVSAAGVAASERLF